MHRLTPRHVLPHQWQRQTHTPQKRLWHWPVPFSCLLSTARSLLLERIQHRPAMRKKLPTPIRSWLRRVPHKSSWRLHLWTACSSGFSVVQIISRFESRGWNWGLCSTSRCRCWRGNRGRFARLDGCRQR